MKRSLSNKHKTKLEKRNKLSNYEKKYLAFRAEEENFKTISFPDYVKEKTQGNASSFKEERMEILTTLLRQNLLKFKSQGKIGGHKKSLKNISEVTNLIVKTKNGLLKHYFASKTDLKARAFKAGQLLGVTHNMEYVQNIHRYQSRNWLSHMLKLVESWHSIGQEHSRLFIAGYINSKEAFSPYWTVNPDTLKSNYNSTFVGNPISKMNQVIHGAQKYRVSLMKE